MLEAMFGAIAPALPNASTIWGITSSDGGATWTPPADVRSGPNEQLAYASDLTARMAGATPVLTVPQAGALVIQTGLGAGSPTFLLNNTTTDGSVVDVDSAVDAASGEGSRDGNRWRVRAACTFRERRRRSARRS